jgi:hypothetical protein
VLALGPPPAAALVVGRGVGQGARGGVVHIVSDEVAREELEGELAAARSDGHGRLRLRRRPRTTRRRREGPPANPRRAEAAERWAGALEEREGWGRRRRRSRIRVSVGGEIEAGVVG